ncbi:hypothetical protein FS842_005872 [Serendipita sp. 407]|nr:hypothetical protein FS842_005872 [Serendipita sp. 407]
MDDLSNCTPLPNNADVQGFMVRLSRLLCVVINVDFLRPRVAAYSIFILWTIIWGLNLGVYHVETNYEFTYGQLISISTCIPSLFSVCKLVWKSYRQRMLPQGASIHELNVIA